jgi:hypothetical protein
VAAGGEPPPEPSGRARTPLQDWVGTCSYPALTGLAALSTLRYRGRRTFVRARTHSIDSTMDRVVSQGLRVRAVTCAVAIHRVARPWNRRATSCCCSGVSVIMVRLVDPGWTREPPSGCLQDTKRGQPRANGLDGRAGPFHSPIGIDGNSSNHFCPSHSAPMWHSPPAIRHTRLRLRRPGIGSALHA